MTDRTQAPVRWSAAALLAPTTAAVFAGVTAWTLHHAPPGTSTSAATVSPPPAAAPIVATHTRAPDPALAALRVAIQRDARRVEALQRTLKALQPQPVAGPAATDGTSLPAAATPPAYAAQVPAGVSVAAAPAPVAAALAPAPVAAAPAPAAVVPAPAPAPAPVTHVVTGASGAPK